MDTTSRYANQTISSLNKRRTKYDAAKADAAALATLQRKLRSCALTSDHLPHFVQATISSRLKETPRRVNSTTTSPDAVQRRISSCTVTRVNILQPPNYAKSTMSSRNKQNLKQVSTTTREAHSCAISMDNLPRFAMATISSAKKETPRRRCSPVVVVQTQRNNINETAPTAPTAPTTPRYMASTISSRSMTTRAIYHVKIQRQSPLLDFSFGGPHFIVLTHAAKAMQRSKCTKVGSANCISVVKEHKYIICNCSNRFVRYTIK
jgi:hypothetical protein